jgi:hypothetical protein
VPAVAALLGQEPGQLELVLPHNKLVEVQPAAALVEQEVEAGQSTAAAAADIVVAATVAVAVAVAELVARSYSFFHTKVGKCKLVLNNMNLGGEEEKYEENGRRQNSAQEK